jgi:sucrose-6-phosphate hydrolase SacC (GH32 family)
VVDHKGSAGFGRDALVAIYTGADHAANRQNQCLAYSTDAGRHWTKYAGNPVLDEGLADFRDPNVFWHEPTRRWIMAVVRSTENRAAIYASPDLRAWTLLGFIETEGAPGHLWECPLLIQLPVEGTGATRWLFKVDVLSGAPGSGAVYRTGMFDGARFIADGPWHVADHGDDFYAAIAWHSPRDAAGRPVWIGWMGNHAVQAHLPLQGWRGAMGVPRRMSLVRAGADYRLCQCVEPAVLAAFAPARPLTLGLVPIDLAPGMVTGLIGGLALEDGEGRRLEITRHADHVVVTRRDPVTAELDAEARASLSPDAAITVLIDHGSIELFADDGLVALTLQHRLSGPTWRAGADRAMTVDYRASA